jgi:hypothetical protein
MQVVRVSMGQVERLVRETGDAIPGPTPESRWGLCSEMSRKHGEGPINHPFRSRA